MARAVAPSEPERPRGIKRRPGEDLLARANEQAEREIVRSQRIIEKRRVAAEAESAEKCRKREREMPGSPWP